VYLAWDVSADTEVAIKEYLPKELVGRAANSALVRPHSTEKKRSFEYGLRRFLQEAQVLADFKPHPTVVRVLSFFQANGTAYLVMPYYHGKTLE